jgi:hypothetical protein
MAAALRDNLRRRKTQAREKAREKTQESTQETVPEERAADAGRQCSATTPDAGPAENKPAENNES